MKIEFDVPDWAIGKHIYIFANEELIGYSNFIIEKKPKRKEYYTTLKIKTQRCNGCSECCESGSPFDDSEGTCPHHTDKGCSLGTNIPFSCARSDCSITFKNCSERFE